MDLDDLLRSMLRFSPYLNGSVIKRESCLKKKKKETLYVNFTTEYIIRRKTILSIVLIGNTIFLIRMTYIVNSVLALVL